MAGTSNTELFELPADLAAGDPLSPQDLYALAVKLESESLTGGDGQPISTENIFAVLETLWEYGVDLTPAADDKTWNPPAPVI
jgi:hypothetical protein